MSWSCCDEMFNDGRNEAEAEAAATISQLQAEIARYREALAEIANETEVHTKLNQERLCCKFQHVARAALGGSNDRG